MAGEFKVNGVSFATESGGTLTVNNSKVRLPSSGNGIEDSSGNSVLSESGGKTSINLTGDFVPSQPMMFRNKIYNGAMQINQRGSTAVSAGTDNVYSVDRFNVGTSGGTAAYTLNNATEVPSGNGFAKSFHLDVTTADASMDTSHGYYLRYKFEGQDLQDLCKGTSSSKEVTLSFWVKSPKSGIHVVELFDNDNTRHICKSYNVASINTWQKIILNFVGDTTGAFGNDNLLSLTINWWLAAGTNFTSGTLNTSWGAYTAANRAVGQVNVMDNTSNNFYITGVQLEVGSSATPFEHRPIGMEQELCNRYYQKGSFHMLTYRAYSGNWNESWPVQFRTSMRAAPAMSQSSVSTTNLNNSTFSYITEYGFTYYTNVAGNGAIALTSDWAANIEL